MIWFTSDLHLGHRAVINFQDRPFGTVEEMNEALIKNWNFLVAKNDTVYILGDISHRCPVEDDSDSFHFLYQTIGTMSRKRTHKIDKF